MPPEVKVRLVVEGTPEALAQFRAANAGAQHFAKSANAGFRVLLSTLRAIQTTLGAVGIAMGVSQILAFGAAVVRTAREAGDTAKSLGTVASRLSALNAVTDLSNEKQEVMAKGLSHLGSKLDDLKRGEPGATAAFARLGLKAKDFPGDDVAIAADIVARALAKMRDGATKSAAAAGVLGEQIGRKLIPVFQKLVDIGGLEGAIGYAKRTGQFVDDATVATLEQLTESMKRLKLEASSAALEFVKGFGPQAVVLIDDLSKSFDPRGVSALQAWGNASGKAIRNLIADLRIAWTWTDSVIRRLGRGAELSSLSMSFPGEPGRAITSQEAAELLIRQRRVQAGIQEQRETRERTFARMRAIAIAADDESEIHVAMLRREQALDDESYRDGLMRLKNYLVERNNRIRTETFAQVTARENIIKTLEGAGPLVGEDAAHVAALRQEIKLLRREEEQRLAAPPPDRQNRTSPVPTPGPTDARLRESEQAELQAAQAKNAALEAQAKASYEAGLSSLRAYYAARRDAIRENEAAELDLLTAEWTRAQKIKDPAQRAAALTAIDARTQELLAKADQQRTEADSWYVEERKKLEKSLAEIADKLRAAEDQEHESKLRQIAEIQEAERRALVGLGDNTPAAQAQASDQAQADADVLRRAEDFRYQLERAKAELESLTSSDTLSDKDVERFKALAKELEKAATAIGPDAVKAVHDFVHNTDQAAKKTVELTDYGQAAAGALAQGFTDVGDEINSASDALLNFIRLLGRAIEQVAATRLAEKLVSYIPGLTTVKKAGGGLIYGPGTGTSDSVPAMLSTGEYVVRAAAVRRPGVLPLLEQVNRAPTPAAYRLRIPDGYSLLRRYAEGGLVLGQRTTSVTAHADVGGTIYVAPAPGAVITEMRTPAGQKVFLEHAARNAKPLRRIVGTG